jgi:hypothetical protein
VSVSLLTSCFPMRELLAKYFKLLTDKVEHTEADGDNVRVL